VRHGAKTIEYISRKAWHKGTFVAYALRRFRGAPLAIYIGDEETDEDAFRALADGMTIRVGKSRKSAAQYFLRSQTEVAVFLQNLVHAADELASAQSDGKRSKRK